MFTPKYFLASFFLLTIQALSGVGQVNAQNTLADDTYVVGEINIFGNTQTKPHIILRELALKKGDTLSKEQLKQLRDKAMRQVFNLKLFTSVVIEIEPKNDLGISDINIYLKERWYLFVIPILELGDRNFNEWWETKRLDRLNYGVRVTRFNMRGRNETIRINLQSGFTRKASLDYSFPYINKALTIGADVNFTYSDNKEVWYKTEDNKLQQFRDPDNVLFRRYKTGITFNYRKKIYSTHRLINEYNNLSIADTITSEDLNSNFFRNANTNQQTIYTAYNYTYDIRDFRQYALNGYMFSAEVGRFTFLNYDGHFYQALVLGEYYKKLTTKSYFDISGSVKYSSTSKQPYNLYRAFGYNFFVRGFEYNVIDGQHAFLGKVNYRYNIIKQKQYSLNTNKFKKFSTIPIAAYLKVYYDGGYVNNPEALKSNTFANTYLNGYGVGLDLVTYYDRVVMFEYSFNNKGQRGLFLHFNSTF
jgi:outer membrane protein assembly factor BamA